MLGTPVRPANGALPRATDAANQRGYVAPERKATWFSAFVLLFSELVGTGILSLPFALSVLGWIPGVCLIVFFGALAMYRYGPCRCRPLHSRRPDLQPAAPAPAGCFCADSRWPSPTA